MNYTKVKRLFLLRLIHRVLPIGHKLDFLIEKHLALSSSLAIKYFNDFYICTTVTPLNRSTISEIIWEGSGSQPEIHLIKEIQRKLGNDLTFVDIGGNIGSFMWQFADKSREIIIFEPIPRLSKVIEESILYNNAKGINLVKKALGDHPHTVKMLDNNNSSIVEGDAQSDTLLVEVSTMDIEVRDVTKIDFIKIDVEGFELKVLKGGLEIIKKHRPVMLIELHPGFILNYGDKYDDVIDLVEQSGYKITYYSFLNELRQSRYRRVINRWAGNPGNTFKTRQEFTQDILKKPELSSYHLYCEPF